MHHHSNRNPRRDNPDNGNLWQLVGEMGNGIQNRHATAPRCILGCPGPWQLCILADVQKTVPTSPRRVPDEGCRNCRGRAQALDTSHSGWFSRGESPVDMFNVKQVGVGGLLILFHIPGTCHVWLSTPDERSSGHVSILSGSAFNPSESILH